MAKKRTDGAVSTLEQRYLSAPEVAGLLGITISEHMELTSSPSYPRGQYGEGNVFLGYLRDDVVAYGAKLTDKKSEVPEEAKTIFGMPGTTVKAIHPGESVTDPSVQYRSISLPTTDHELAKSLAFTRGFSTQWTTDELLRWRKLVAGLVRTGATYHSYQDPPGKREIKVMSNIQTALRYLLRLAVPLTHEELKSIGLAGKCEGDEPGVQTIA